jgi:hypothetical protein
VHAPALRTTWRLRGTQLARSTEHENAKEDAMARCDTCGNDYDKAFQVTKDNQTYTFDSFECAIHRLAPPCEHCGCRIVGHGVEEEGNVYCCASCARALGRTDLRDRGDSPMVEVPRHP